MKSHHFGKCFHLIGYNNIHGDSHDLHPKIWGIAIPRIDGYGT